MRQGQRATSHGIGRWLLPAFVLHAGSILLAAALSRWTAPTDERAAPLPSALEESELKVELIPWDDDERSRVTPGAIARVEAAARASEWPRPTDALHMPRPQSVPRDESSLPLVTARRESADGARAALPSEATAPPAATANERHPRAAPRLSLDQLGIGTNPFMATSMDIEPLSKEEQANLRLQAALHPVDVGRERQRGLGPEGPVVSAARSLVLADEGLVETRAVVNVRVDASGRVTEVHLVDASSQIKAWQLIAARLAKALAPVTLRRAEAPQGWDMKLRLASSVQLPSGVAPGLRMGVLGQQIAGDGGAGATRLELSHTSKLDIPEPVDSIGRHRDSPMRLEAMLLQLKGDLSDIGAPARRVVEVAVLSIDAPTGR
jgi:hypothetical protein